jgi:hypothetical protein
MNIMIILRRFSQAHTFCAMLSKGENPFCGFLSYTEKIECVRRAEKNTDAKLQMRPRRRRFNSDKSGEKGPRTFQRLLERGRGLMRSSIVGDLAHSKGLCCE